ncbi:MAG: hypothetical protein KC619_30360, partial [Myxococcales bacterium]|nr:hypothetical protein [Myxococcales bacterium]
LFLGAGSVMHAVHAHGDADIRYLGGLRRKLPATHATFLVATIAIAGLPPLAGFFSKDEILLGAMTWFFESPARWNTSVGVWENFSAGNWAGGWVGMFVFVVLSIAAAMTAFYMFRLYFRTFWGEYKGGHAPDEHAHGDDHAHDEHGHWVEPHESPDSMTTPLWVLATGAALVGFLGLPHLIPVHGINWWSSWMTPQHEEFLHAYEHALEGGVEHMAALDQASVAARRVYSPVAALSFDDQMVHAPPLAAGLAMGVGLLVALFGFGLAFAWYKQGDGSAPANLMQSVPKLHRFLMDKWRVDELYEATIIALMKWLGVVSANLDRFLVDMLLTKATSWLMKGFGFVVTRAQNGVIFAYAGMFVAGLAGLTWWFTYPHPMPEGEEDAIGVVHWKAIGGLGTELRWDFDSDGEWDTEWSEEGEVDHDYANHRREDPNDHSGASIDAYVGIFETLADNFGPREHVVEPGGSPVSLDFPNVIPDEMWQHPAAPPDGGFDRFLFDLFGPVAPTMQSATVQRFDGRIPTDQVPEPSSLDGKRHVRLAFSIHALTGEGQADPTASWGPVERDVVVAEDGRFSVLLGADEPLSLAQIPQARIVDEDGNEEVRFRGVVRFGSESEEIDFAPQAGMLVRIHDAAIRDDDIDDGMLLLEPGARIPVGNEMFLTVAVQMRATVEARNAFGNTTRSSEAVTVRVARRAHAQAEVAR